MVGHTGDIEATVVACKAADQAVKDGEQLTKEQIEAEIRKIKEAHAEDEEYPDEVDTPTDVFAHKRFAKYTLVARTLLGQSFVVSYMMFSFALHTSCLRPCNDIGGGVDLHCTKFDAT